jgi:hypothetical protein
MRTINTAKLAMSALAATLLSANASALMEFDPDAPKQVYKTKIMCLNSYGSDGQVSIGAFEFCDQSKNNKTNKRPLKEHGCVEGQVAVSETINQTAKEKFKIKIKECAVENDSVPEPMQL